VGEEAAGGVCCGDAAGRGAVGCGVGCVVCAKPSEEKKARLASSNLKERFRIVKVNDGSIFNGNNKLAICQNCQQLRFWRQVHIHV
jgi:hypothetical protein